MLESQLGKKAQFLYKNMKRKRISVVNSRRFCQNKRDRSRLSTHTAVRMRSTAFPCWFYSRFAIKHKLI